MPEPRFEEQTRNAEKSFQAAQSTSIDTYRTGIDLFRKGMERSIEAQLQLLDVAVQQNEETVELWRSMFGNIPGAEPMFHFAQQTVDQCIEMQKRTLEIMGQQGGEMAKSAKTQGEHAAHAAREVTDATHRERKSA